MVADGTLCAEVRRGTTGSVTAFPIGTGSAYLHGIAAGPDGNLWFTEYDGNRVGRITPGGTVTEFSAGITAGAKPHGIAAGPDGNLWFTEGLGDNVGRITTTGTVTEFPGSTLAGEITAGPDGNMWFTESVGSIGRITPAGTITQFRTDQYSFPIGIAAGADGNLWYTDLWSAEDDEHRIGRITPAGVVEQFREGLSWDNAGPRGITAGPGGDMWFTETNADLATGCDRVLVLAPQGRSARVVRRPEHQVAKLRDGGAQVLLLQADLAPNASMSASALPGARERGRRQGRAARSAVEHLWG